MNPFLNFALYFKDPNWAPYIYELVRKMQDGHVCINIDNPLCEETLQHFFVKKTISSNVITETTSAVVSYTPSTTAPFVLHNRHLYLQRYFKYETNILDYIQSNAKRNHPLSEHISFLQNNHTFLQNLFPKTGTATNWQKVAVVNSFLNTFSVITGGPGTGKTTTVVKLLSLYLLQNPNTQIALAAPTGKAANRLMESIQQIPIDSNNQQLPTIKMLQATTLHRLLGYIPNSITFKHHKNNLLPYDIVLVDECSMIDISLFAKLMNALKPNAKLILLGDKNQLASVEAGSIFGDICNAKLSINQFSETKTTLINTLIQGDIITHRDTIDSTSIIDDCIVELTKSYRFKDDDIIGQLSKAIIQNQQSELENIFSKPQSSAFILDETYAEQTLTSFINQLQQYIFETDITTALQTFNDYRILCATRMGNSGTEQLNTQVEAYLERLGLIEKTNNIVYENKPIMITENHYELGLFNGDIGILRKNDEGVLKAWFWNNQQMELKQYTPNILPKFETVFAMTIHKSQGSEFKHVLIVLPEGNSQILNRELLYTAITRAKESITIQAKQESIMAICQIAVSRSSGLTQRLQSISQ